MGIELPPPSGAALSKPQPVDFAGESKNSSKVSNKQNLKVGKRSSGAPRKSFLKAGAPEIRTVYADDNAANAAFKFVVRIAPSNGLSIFLKVKNASGILSKVSLSL